MSNFQFWTLVFILLLVWRIVIDFRTFSKSEEWDDLPYNMRHTSKIFSRTSYYEPKDRLTAEIIQLLLVIEIVVWAFIVSQGDY